MSLLFVPKLFSCRPHKWVGAWCVVTLAGCAAPAVEVEAPLGFAVPAVWSGQPVSADSPAVLGHWWRRFDDPVLTQLVDQALGNLTLTVTANGTLQPTRTITIGSELSDIVRQVNVDVNDYIKKGQVLVVLDTAKLSDQILRSGASLAAAPADGVVLTRSVEPGNAVTASLQAVTLLTVAEDLSKLGLWVYVDEADLTSSPP